jgi:hypothetical protein
MDHEPAPQPAAALLREPASVPSAMQKVHTVGIGTRPTPGRMGAASQFQPA